MTNLQTTIIYTSMLDSLICEFTHKESNKAINEIKKQTKKFLHTKKKQNLKLFVEAIQVANKAWVNSIDHFAAKEFKIDVYSLICGLHCEKEDLFKKYTNVSHKRIEKFLIGSPQDHTVLSELQAYEVSKFLINEIEKESKCKNGTNT